MEILHGTMEILHGTMEILLVFSSLRNLASHFFSLTPKSKYALLSP